jgi:hypothetical protein
VTVGTFSEADAGGFAAVDRAEATQGYESDAQRISGTVARIAEGQGLSAGPLPVAYFQKCAGITLNLLQRKAATRGSA